MPKPLCIAGGIVAALLFLIFVLDLAVLIPFGRGDITMDIGMIICSLVLGYVSWATYREQK
jgi:hypothetical protein